MLARVPVFWIGALNFLVSVALQALASAKNCSTPNALEHLSVYTRGNLVVFMRVSVGLLTQGCVYMSIGVLAGLGCRIAGGLCWQSKDILAV